MSYDLIVVGSGAAGMMAAIRAAELGKNVLLLEKLSSIGAKLKATGGGRCNLTNTLDNETFMSRFGREGRFMSCALETLDSSALRSFFKGIGVDTHAPDGFRVFPLSHSSQTIIDALQSKMAHVGIEVQCKEKVVSLILENGTLKGVRSANEDYFAPNVIIATGGMGYPMLGAEGDGYRLASEVGHHTSPLYPAMMPLFTKERWVAECRADTIAKAHLVVNLKKQTKLQAKGDLIFTKEGIRGPVVLDFSREITPLLAKLDEVPLLANLTGGMNEEQIRNHFKAKSAENPQLTTIELIQTLLPASLSTVFCSLCDADPSIALGRQRGVVRDQLIKYLAWVPLTVTGHQGFKMAMITRGGIPLKEIDPLTLQSRLLKGLYFCGEVMDLDGPCGGYNLQWSFASGFLAGELRG